MSLIHDPNNSYGSPERLSHGGAQLVQAKPLMADSRWEASGEADGEGLFEYLRILWRRKLLLLMLGLVGAGLGLTLGILMPKMYRSHASLEIQGRNQKFLNMQTLDPISSDYSSVEIETQVSLLQNRSLIHSVLNKMLRGSNNVTSGEGTGQIASSVDASRASALQAAAWSFAAQSSDRTRIVEISCESTDPKAAADFLNGLANEFIDQGVEARWNSTQRTSNWLTSQLQDLKKNLETSEGELLNYARGSALLFTNDKDTVADQKLRELQAELSAAQADRISKQSRHELAKSSPPDSLTDFLNDPSLRGYESTLTDLRRQLADLSASFTAEHYKVKHIQAQIAEVDGALYKKRQNVLRQIQNSFEEARRREQLLTSMYGEQSKLVGEQASTAIHYNMLKREVDASKQLYDSLLQQLREAAIASAMQASAIRVVEPAIPSSAPSRPMPVLYSTLGFGTALFLGSVFAVVRQRTDPYFHAPGDSLACLSVPELGVIPMASLDKNRDKTLRSRAPLFAKPVRVRMVRNTSTLKLSGITDPAGRGPTDTTFTPSECLELVTWQRKPSMLAESFRATLASLLFAGENSGRVIVVTSSGPREGKTTMVSNLGIALAEINRRVLLIDGDMRQPRLHSILGVSNSWGLSDVLRESNAIRSYPWPGLARETCVPNLSLLPSGPGVVSASNLLYSPRLGQLLERLGEAFDMVLIDTPPLLDLPDARILGQVASGVILVVRAGKTAREDAVSGCARLAQDSTRVIGTILNDWRPQGASKKHLQKYRQQRPVEVMS